MNARTDRLPGQSADRMARLAMRVYARMAARIDQAFGEQQAASRVGPMLRLEVAAEGLEPLAWLAAQHKLPRLYWADREQRRGVAGVGLADRLALAEGMTPAELVERTASRLQDASPGVRYYGGFRFDAAAAVSAEWQPFGLGWLALPRFELVSEGGRVRFACNAFPGRDSRARLLEELGGLVCDIEPLSPVAPPVRKLDSPSRGAWAGMVRAVTDSLGRGELCKLVLARRTDMVFAERPDALALLAALSRRSGPCFHFYFNPGGDTAFLGASPERLFHRRGRHVGTEALAGTRARGATGAEDDALRAELLNCGKDGREHACVVRYLEHRLAPLTTGATEAKALQVLGLPHVQHLHVGLSGALGPGVSDAALLDSLHPTPAVAGDPPPQALHRIAALEPFDRGWYAGPVGYVGAEESEFAVAIRSGLLHDRELALFVGAGIVQGSDAAAEWQELESKMASLRAAWADE
ncbi:MAG: isochorismate synthase [Gammaproteobacteria bacterium]|nr:MAG: isochorismate synthase [Gammaproteobacteria bacterium]